MIRSQMPAPGAVALVCGGGGRNPDAARDAALGAFGGHDAQVFADGPLTLAWNASQRRAVHVSDTTVCLLEGALHELSELRQIAGVDGSPERLLAGAYERIGVSIFERLRGEFWALLWDRKRREGALVTDHLGTHSPFWAHEQGDLVLASEVPELLASLSHRPEPDPLVLAHWLQVSSQPGGRTLFAGVRRLQAGHWLALGSDETQPKRFWSPSFQAPLHMPRGELVALMREALSRAVERRLQSTPAAGVLLSGGIDSSSVAAIAAAAGRPLHAYSATFPDHPAADEAALIDSTVTRLGMPSTRIVVRSGSVIAGALSYLDAWQLPPTSPNLFFWTPLMKRAAADGIELMLDGEGGDETFHFSPYLLADFLRRGRVLSALRLSRGWTPPAHSDSLRRRWIRLRRFGLKGALPAYAHTSVRRARAMEHYAPAWLNPSLARAWLDSEESAYDWKRLAGPRWWSFLLFGITRGVGPALVYEQSRRRTGIAGIDTCHPLVDVDVVELVLRMPPALAFDHRYNRPLLRESVAGLLPDEVRLRRTKSNFDAVFHGALAGADLPVARRLLSDRNAALREYIDIGAVHRQLLDPSPPADEPWRARWAVHVWRLVTAECWLRGQADVSFARSLAEREQLAGADYELVARD